METEKRPKVADSPLPTLKNEYFLTSLISARPRIKIFYYRKDALIIRCK